MSLLKNWLEKKTYQVKYTSSQEEVPEIIKKFRPELLIVDVLQKEIIKQLRAHDETRFVPILLMTGYTTKQTNCFLPVNDIIEKPFNLNLLEKKIQRLIQRVA
jgi:DNA-binding response OmpR family regulator